jgi:hypothetical protein
MGKNRKCRRADISFPQGKQKQEGWLESQRYMAEGGGGEDLKFDGGKDEESTDLKVGHYRGIGRGSGSTGARGFGHHTVGGEWGFVVASLQAGSGVFQGADQEVGVAAHFIQEMVSEPESEKASGRAQRFLRTGFHQI